MPTGLVWSQARCLASGLSGLETGFVEIWTYSETERPVFDVAGRGSAAWPVREDGCEELPEPPSDSRIRTREISCKSPVWERRKVGGRPVWSVMCLRLALGRG